jgi:hypothetical protein
MATLAPEAATYTHWSQRQPADSLDHIPGDDGWPIVGTTFKQLADPIGFNRRMRETYGQVFRMNSFGARSVAMIVRPRKDLLVGTGLGFDPRSAVSARFDAARFRPPPG